MIAKRTGNRGHGNSRGGGNGLEGRSDEHDGGGTASTSRFRAAAQDEEDVALVKADQRPVALPLFPFHAHR